MTNEEVQQPQQQRQKTMVGRASSSSTTAASLAILGLSVTFLRWWNANNNNNKHDHPLSALFPASGGGKRLKSVSSWWPIIAIQRWMERNSRINSTTIAGDEEYYSNNEEHNAVVVEVVNHQGSCHCGSIKFQLYGPRKLRAIDYSSSSSSSSSPPIRKNRQRRRRRPVCFFSTSIPISANKFQLITGQDSMRFYYEDDNNDATTANNDSYSLSITPDHHTSLNNISNNNNNNNNQALGAHSFCTNCGVHVFYADRNSGRLEVNANCIIGQAVGDDGEKVSITTTTTTTTSSAVAALAIATTTMKTPIVNNKTGLSHKNNEPLLALAGASFIESLDYNNVTKNNNSSNDLSNNGQCYSSSSSSNNNNKELSVTSTTDPESSYSTAIMMDGDDTSSMGSQSATSAYLSLYHTSHHGVLASPLATSHDRTTTTAMMGAGPRIPSSNRSVKTLPPRLGGGIGSGWSVTSSDDLLFNMDDDDGEEQTTVSPKMRDRMMKYLKRHIDPIQEDK
jgi:hypothetical protein